MFRSLFFSFLSLVLLPQFNSVKFLQMNKLCDGPRVTREAKRKEEESERERLGV